MATSGWSAVVQGKSTVAKNTPAQGPMNGGRTSGAVIGSGGGTLGSGGARQVTARQVMAATVAKSGGLPMTRPDAPPGTSGTGSDGGGGGSGNDPLPFDSNAERALSEAQEAFEKQLAEARKRKAQLYSEVADPNSSFSRISRLNHEFAAVRRGNENSMAARGHLYSGALTNRDVSAVRLMELAKHDLLLRYQQDLDAIDKGVATGAESVRDRAESIFERMTDQFAGNPLNTPIPPAGGPSTGALQAPAAAGGTARTGWRVAPPRSSRLPATSGWNPMIQMQRAR